MISNRLEDIRDALLANKPTGDIIKEHGINRGDYNQIIRQLSKQQDKYLYQSGAGDMALELDLYLENMAHVIAVAKEATETIRKSVSDTIANNGAVDNDTCKLLLESLKFLKEIESERMQAKVQILQNIEMLKQVRKGKKMTDAALPAPRNSLAA